MAVLMIGATERETIAEMIAYAKAHPVPISVIRQGVMDDSNVLELKDCPPEFKRPPTGHMTFPGGFCAAFSIEQQPPGLYSHLSISVVGRPQKGAMPHPAAVEMIAREFGVPCPADKMWMEEFAPGEFAINLLSLHAPTKEGTA